MLDIFTEEGSVNRRRWINWLLRFIIPKWNAIISEEDYIPTQKYINSLWNIAFIETKTLTVVKIAEVWKVYRIRVKIYNI